MGTPIKHSTDAATRRQEKTDSIDKVVVFDAQIDTSHSVNDEFGYPLWSTPKDQGNNSNSDGAVQPTSTDGDGDDTEGN